VKRANVESALGAEEGATASILAITEIAGAGAGVCTSCTDTWETTHSEQSEWLAEPSE
jgi:hypothetical protein